MVTRLLVVTALFLASAGYVGFAMEPERVPLREPLSGMTYDLGEWSGRPAPRLTDEVLAVLGVDEYLNRYYVSPQGAWRGSTSATTRRQREGDTIHSPMNCLPGAGWQPVRTDRVDIGISGRAEPIHVNEVVIQKGLDRQLVLYWYQSQGRVVASEYWSKVFMVTDAIRYNRSDAALVRVVTPVGNSATGLDDARERARAFVQVLFPQLDRHLPS